MRHFPLLVTLAAALCCLAACDTTNDDFPMPAEPTVVDGKYVVQFNLSYDKPAPRIAPAYVVPSALRR